ncbi:tetratricopeptide repeat protein [Methanococcus aeolicus]|uniref:TPR repeat-containing protein n=1 Tax=Methanococcus aeolicus (strain ATCC BAA-1280 / DSM 17508 / OCM 812 / Nankai-3) TaxID=419665 RepID=A6UTB0_META3|nr:tetratricopeptide repeat protein [Methanococcus aeolicus]ABR55732.1 TPR repeat-containing protein [Methanococcus aeolicus Nankai-3]UXM85233.1 tetratricopeptide repeat protein [Methanococcus aeolicus]
MNWEGYLKKGNEYKDKEDYDKAIEYYNEALKNYPYKFKWRIFINLGHCYYLKKDYDEAIKNYKEASKNDYPDKEKWIVCINLGQCYNSKKEYDKAIEYYKKGLRLGGKEIKKYGYNSAIISTYIELENIDDNDKRNEYFGSLVKIMGEIDNFKEELKVNNNKDNPIIAHYTKPHVITDMLKLKENKEEKENKEDKTPYFRLYEVCYMNDPEEGMTLKEIMEKEDEITQLYNIYEDENSKKDMKKENYTFLGSFIVGEGGNEKEYKDIDKLFLWRTYGKDGDKEEAKGICICINKEFFDQNSDNLSNYPMNINNNDNPSETILEYGENPDEFCLYKVIYEDTNELITVLKKIDKYAKDLDLKNNKIKKLLNRLLDELRYLVKSKHYTEEKEYRIIKRYNINKEIDINEINKNKIKIDYDIFSPRLYIEIEKDFTEYIDKIVLGPRLENKDSWKSYLNYKDIDVMESTCPFK